MIRVNGRLSNLLILGLSVHGCCHPCIKTRIFEHLLLNCRYFAAICQNAARYGCHSPTKKPRREWTSGCFFH